ncbi:uncharacterized protein LOC113320475 isoform X3 [Papaver somniferum]|uniref:uncharacterized protein LOC113320475 isoform X3 n=1 Tax=Papaver somniferum TaxID=3469 RepID=UPI000E704C09|nr:uncharacterized protein LOC113320475 isoform X3 [Papaver somniferum]
MVKFQSRKSTHKRQRQYFEQKKRQQHSNRDDDAEGTHGSAEYHRTPKSLDILSLLTLGGEAKGGNSGCNNEFSLLDLLGEDGSNGKAEGSPVRECHVAFSVEGLGKTRMEIPVHSPQQQCRFHCDRNLGMLNPASDKIPNKFRKLVC